jgi:hypothetical protein
MKLSFKLPYIMYFDDYHEISDFVDRINELTGGKPKLKYTEIMGESDYGYKALFYVGKQDKAYKAMLKAYNETFKKVEDDEG